MNARNQSQRWIESLSVTLVLLIFAALYLTSINHAVFVDEAYTLRNFTFSIPQTLLSYYAPNNHILHSILMGICETFIGNSPPSIRLPAFVSAMLSLALAYRVTQRVIDGTAGRQAGHTAGLLALVLLGTNLGFADYAVNARGYTLAICLTLVLMDLLLHPPVSIEQPRRRYGWGLLLTACGLLLTLPSMVLLIIGVGLWIITQRRELLFTLPPMLVGSTLAGLVYGVNLVTGRLDAYLHGFGAHDGQVPLPQLAQEWMTLVFDPPVIAVVLAAALVAGLVITARDARLRQVSGLTIWIIGSALVIAIGQSLLLNRVFFARNYLYVLAPMVVIAGIALARLPKSAWIVPLLIAVSVVPLLQMELPNFVDDLLAKIDANLQPDDALVVDCCEAESAWYHLMRQGREELMGKHPGMRQVIVVSDAVSLPGLIQEVGLEGKIAACEPITDGSWDPFTVYRCPWTGD